MITLYLANRGAFGMAEPDVIWYIALIETLVECIGISLLFGLPL